MNAASGLKHTRTLNTNIALKQRKIQHTYTHGQQWKKIKTHTLVINKYIHAFQSMWTLNIYITYKGMKVKSKLN